MATTDKAEVLNTITLFNTVGQEIEDILSANNIDVTDFILFMGWEGNQLCSIKRISLPDLKKIEGFIGINGLKDYLLTFQKQHKETEIKALESYKNSKKIFNKLKPMLSLLGKDFVNGIDLLADIADFFDVEDETSIPAIAETNVARYKSPYFEPDTINLYAWLRRGQIDFENCQFPQYNKQALLKWVNDEEWKEHLIEGDYFYSLVNLFNSFGVSLVFTPYLHKTVYGAVRWIKGTPIIQISDFEKNLATCWYTLFHEIGHVVLHENDNICEGDLNESKRKTNKKESEANKFAADHLFGGDGLRKFIFDYRIKIVDDNFIAETALKFNIREILVAYWMHKAQVNNRKYLSYMPKVNFSLA